ncbi:hypothetical protein A7P53_00565 [Acinetobacter defluvii]|uniref:RsiV family protein n=1 Tax=Acinetobacter defluvii TaxID=1871111 RepID=UPI00148F63C7|nr:RsiV family protein [Acinetobacter defluvii]NNP72401.1 hypothetical protein [Acinetobacter defluvii]
MQIHLKKTLVISVLFSSFLMASGCQEKPASSADAQASSSQAKAEQIPLIQAKVIRVELPRKQFCDDDGCTQYDLQTVKTDIAWIDDYFLNRIKKDVPIAFEKNQKTTQAADLKGLNQNSIYVRFISQQYNLATFMIQSYTYAAGAAHGMYHNEYVTFDLSTQKRLALTDILKPNVETKVAEQLYDANANWLTQHDITREKLQLSDNYYYGSKGIVFVYPLYELASYAEGMTELTLPYLSAKDLVKAEYLPSLPVVDAVTEEEPQAE